MEDNKLIAEFMEVDQVDIDTWLESNSKLKYHISWDWLMPVILRCRIDSRCELDEDIMWDKIVEGLEECNLPKTYEAVVEFINQYNKENESIN